jgi:flagellar hook assembly protein FlgD
MKKTFAILIISIIAFSTLLMIVPSLKAATETTIFSDNFESYTPGTFPSSGGWQLVYNGKGTSYQVITNAYYHSYNKSLQLWGYPNWSALAMKSFSSTSRFLGYQVSMLMNTIGYGTPGRSEYVGFYNSGILTWGKHWAIVAFDMDTMKIMGESSAVLGTWTTGTWYTVRTILDRNTNTYSVWINGQLKGTNIKTTYDDTSMIAAMQLQSGHPGVPVYFDDVSVFAPFMYPSLNVSPNPFSPNGDGSKDITKIETSFYANVNWNLQVRTISNVILRTWTGSGNTLSVVWNGKNSTGFLVPDGTYNVRLSITLSNGTILPAVYKGVTVDKKAPTVTGISVTPSAFNPGSGQKTSINYTLSESCYVTAKIFSNTGVTEKTLLSVVSQSAGFHSIVWNGKDSSGKIVPPDIYMVILWIVDKAGNKATNSPIVKTVIVT